MIAGILNLFVSIGQLAVTVNSLNMPEEEFKTNMLQAWDGLPQEFRAFYERQGINRETFVTQSRAALPMAMGSAAITAVLAILPILGGVMMRRLRGYPLAMTGAVLVAVPCLSPLGCCLMGEVIGIWCLVVLLAEDVRAAFVRSPDDRPEQQGPPS
jgi:hypothetical protein